MTVARVSVAILGFSETERNALAEQFRLAPHRRPGYSHVLSVDDARFIVADGEQPESLALLRDLDRVADALFIGGPPPPGAAGSMPRPIDAARLLDALDALLGPLDIVTAAPMPPALATSALRTIGDPMVAFDAGRRVVDVSENPGRPRRSRRPPVLPPVLWPRALLVDDSEIALHYLRRLLDAYELSVDCAQDSNRALDLLSQNRYGMVFVDLDLGDASPVNGLGLCQQIRHLRLHPGGDPPMVVMVSAFHDAVDQVRGRLAGAEHYLGKPLDRARLDQLLRRQGFSRLERGPSAAAPPHARR